MAIYIRDSDTEALVRAFARKQKLSLTDAVKGAVRDKLKALKVGGSPLHDRLTETFDEISCAQKTGKKANKKFFDALCGEGRTQI